ncbi:MAG: SCO1664 family protein [Acidimicrobiales bacterium]|nr:SCO1664 family protein [Acidimicrobiales bacterium]
MPAQDSTDPVPGAFPTDPSEVVLGEWERLLRDSELVVLGRMPWSSNATLLCELRSDDLDPQVCGRAIYKPRRGERPLWDFPDGLFRREVAAYRLARALGWMLVPPTVEREGPFGVGSVQLFIDADFERHYFELLEDESTHPQLRRLAAFDIVANSTDRKGGHVLIDEAGHLWAIDNGLSFHAEFKLRTVIWDFAGEPLPADLADDIDRIASGLPAELAEFLDPFERDALRTRARALLSEGRFPADPTGHRYPWPLI